MNARTKSTLKIVVIAFASALVAVMLTIGGVFYWAKSTKQNCSNYATENSRGVESADRKMTELYTRCLGDNGLGY